MEYSTAIQHLIPFVMTKYETHEHAASQKTAEFLASQTSEKLGCTKGCGACCHFPLVPVTAGEAFVLLNRVLAEGTPLEELAKKLFHYVEKYFNFVQSKGRLPFLDRDQKKFLAQLLPCPFFVKENTSQFAGHCGIYGMRPLICEFYNSIDSPKLCEQKLGHRSIEAVIMNGSHIQDNLRDFERKLLGRSTLGHLPLLLAALCTQEGLQCFLEEKHLTDEELKEEFAQEIHDFSLYAEMLNSIGYSLSENDMKALEEAQSEMMRD
ncbi:YkgJ family cysteine cluster protein [Silvanigrella aquatica]|uniref:Zinc/iron-chelating domain-containing protein n=1 Tax=Silvanigrella aquatica TaxID=1915309 RepID=A0A1L4CX20_9BACT|nr:YkgJ family cysteine cluster protein [Silvanigrella aquatica]APJ02495.1 hypothetical protein AXG55_00510 [Silvanigrella aquatica]